MEQAPAIGATLELDAKLHHKSDLGEFWLASDALFTRTPVGRGQLA